MSMTLSETDKIYKKPFHRRNDSGDDDELDVFEAARYFSGYNEASAAAAFSQKVLREDHHHQQHQHHRQQQHRQHQAWRGGRISLDMPIRDSSILQLPHHASNSVDPKQLTKDKKYKQPSSPGGRLASFLNSLFSQSGSKKKKSSSSKSMKDEEESPGGRRKQRRSSISHFRSSSSTTTTTTDSSSKSLYSSSSSGFRTPPPYAALHTPTKSSYTDLRSYSDHKHSNIGGQQVPLKPTSSTTIAALLQSNNEVTFNKFKFINNDTDAHPEKHKARNWVASEDQKEKVRKFDEEIDDGAESDSSSDLFELTNYDLGVYSSGLPVYETTHMDSIKRGAPISNGAL